MAGRYVSSVLAQGIETDAHLVRARALGATLGPGWLLGRPTDTRHTNHRPTRQLQLPWCVEPRALGMGTGTPGSPFAALPPGTVLRRSPKRLLVELSKELEREAVRIGETATVAATFQHAVNRPGFVRRSVLPTAAAVGGCSHGGSSARARPGWRRPARSAAGSR